MSFAPRNHILQALEPAIAMKARERLEVVRLKRSEVLQEVGEPVDWVWFLDDSLICIASENIDGESVSGGMVGWRGAYGAFEACGSRQSFTRALVQIPGGSWRLRASHYREIYDQSLGLRTAIHKHVEALLVEARQWVACTAIHPVESRLCRALLDVSDRSHSGSVLAVTQEALANMLGVQRSTIAVIASSLQKQGLIRTGRGEITLVDRARLEQASCSCRRTIAYAEEAIYSSQAPVCEAQA